MYVLFLIKICMFCSEKSDEQDAPSTGEITGYASLGIQQLVGSIYNQNILDNPAATSQHICIKKQSISSFLLFAPCIPHYYRKDF